jgi:hypothetical protein
MKRITKVTLVLLLCATTLLPIGCFAADEALEENGGRASSQVAPMAAPDHMTKDAIEGEYAYEPAAISADGAQPYAPVERMIIRNGTIEIRVKDVDEALPRLKSAAAAAGAEIADLSVSGGSGPTPLGEMAGSAGPSYASVTLRVPAEKLDPLTTELAKLGTVTAQNESSSDVTEQAIDMDARLKNLRAEEDRLRTFLERANKVEDLLAVQRELSRVRGDIEAMQAQLTYLERQVARATLVVTLSEPSPVVGPESPWYGLREAFSQGVQGAIEVVKVMITVVIALMPLALLVALVVWAIVALVRRGNRRKAAAWAAAQEQQHFATAGMGTDGADDDPVE